MNGCYSLAIGIAMLMILLILKIPLWIVFLLVSFSLSILVGGSDFLVNIIFDVSTDPATIDLVVIMYLIAVFVSLYRMTGFIDKLGKELTLLLKKPFIVISFVPAILGLLPVPGGALMSIPIVDKIGDYMGLDKNRKLFLNVWFRHVIFIVYPLSTVIVLTSTLTNTSIWALIVRQAPIALLMVLIGYVVGLYVEGYKESPSPLDEKNANKSLLLKVFSPIVISIAIAIATSKYLDYRFQLPINRLSMILGISIGILVLILFSKIDLGSFAKVLMIRQTIELALIGYGAMMLRGVITSVDLSCIIEYIPQSVPIQLIAVLLPIMFSIISGVASGGIALSIPIIQSLTSISPSLASLIYVSAFIGYLGSPLHLCYIYTAEYLGISIIKGYKYIIPSSIMTLVIAIIVLFVL